jgi:hypothetical protein
MSAAPGCSTPRVLQPVVEGFVGALGEHFDCLHDHMLTWMGVHVCGQTMKRVVIPCCGVLVPALVLLHLGMWYCCQVQQQHHTSSAVYCHQEYIGAQAAALGTFLFVLRLLRVKGYGLTAIMYYTAKSSRDDSRPAGLQSSCIDKKFFG